jgi:O-acetyl-ADP-ribose deacetylase (regulator of RNase III)
MLIQLIDRNIEMCKQWEIRFNDCLDVKIYHGDIFSIKTDCIVSPANSFGFMDGGLDLIISKKLGWQIQSKLQEQIKTKYHGELLVGQAELVETENTEIPFCISAPTMRIPTILTNTPNVYLAAKAIFALLKKENRINSVSICGLGTGVGRVPENVCARQMKQAYYDAWQEKYEFPKNWLEAQIRHQLLYSDKYYDLQQFDYVRD